MNNQNHQQQFYHLANAQGISFPAMLSSAPLPSATAYPANAPGVAYATAQAYHNQGPFYPPVEQNQRRYAIQVPASSSPLPVPTREPSPDLPDLRDAFKDNNEGPRRSPRRVNPTSKGTTVPVTGKWSGSGGSAVVVTEATGGPPKAVQSKVSKKEEISREIGTGRWQDESTDKLMLYFFGDATDGDEKKGCYKEWQSNKSHWHKKASMEVFNGARDADAIKGKLVRLLSTYKHMTQFEDHTGGGGDGDDDGLNDYEKIHKKLESAQAARKDVGNLSVADIEKWRTRGWYAQIDACLGESQNIRRKVNINSLREPSPFCYGSSKSSLQSEPPSGADDGSDIHELSKEELDELAQDPDADKDDVELVMGDPITSASASSQVNKPASTKFVKEEEPAVHGKTKVARPSPNVRVEEARFKKRKTASSDTAGEGSSTASFLAANAAYFDSKAEVDKKSLALREAHNAEIQAIEKMKLRLETAKMILDSSSENITEEMKTKARNVLMEAL